MDFLSNTFLLHHQELHWKKKTFIRLLWWEICIPIFLRGERKKEKDVAIIRVFHRRIFQGHTSLMVSLNACINQGKRRFHIYSSGQILERENSGLVFFLFTQHCTAQKPLWQDEHISQWAQGFTRKVNQRLWLFFFLRKNNYWLDFFLSFCRKPKKQQPVLENQGQEREKQSENRAICSNWIQDQQRLLKSRLGVSTRSHFFHNKY